MFNKIEKCVDLIERTYNIFNGQINPINKAGSLMIITHSSDLCAYMDRHNVIINVNTLLRKFENYIDEMTVETVLHELSHFEQVIDYQRYMNDVEYREQIENANTLNALEYMMRNIDYINSILNIDISKSFIGSLYTQAVQKICSYQYNRIGYKSLYYNAIKNHSSFRDNYLDNILDAVPNIDLHISKGSIVYFFNIKTDGNFNTNTNDFNLFLYKYLDMYDEVTYQTFSELYYDNSLCIFTIFIHSHSKNPISYNESL